MDSRLRTAGLAVLISLQVVASGFSAEPFFEQQPVFEAKQDGYELYRIPGVVVTKAGSVLVYCEARKGSFSDWGTIDLFVRRSVDGGKTFAKRVQLPEVPGPISKNPVAVAQKLAQSEEVTYNNPVAIPDRKTGAVHFLFCLEYMRCFYCRSDDDGQTFSTPVEITSAFDKFRPEYDWKVLATGPAHGIQLENGRLVVPVWLSTGTGGHAHRPSVTSTVFSDDGGLTWQRGAIAVPNTSDWVNPNETVVAQLSDGRVMLNVRSESKAHRRLVTISPDGATNWSTPSFQESLKEPICMAGLVRYDLTDPALRKVLLFSNPDTLDGPDPTKPVPDGRSRQRKNLTIQLSDDDGATWRSKKVIEPNWSGYSDLAVLPDGRILCFYERGSSDGKNIYRTGQLSLARFNREWILHP